MSKRTFIVFGLLVLVLTVVIPWLTFHDRANEDSGPRNVAANLKGGQALFETNCGTCHTLASAGTDGNYAPNLDELLAPSGPPSGSSAASTIKATEGRVLNAVENGVNSSTPGRMPAGILNEQETHEVAEFVAHTAGES
jgi:mono/diheme cytochrome c family protein